MAKKQIIRSIAFVLVAVLMLAVLCDMFEIENTKNYDKNMNTFRNLPQNTIDAVYLGTSGVDRYWMGPKAYEEHGLSIYPVSYDAFPAWLYTNLIDEVLSRQDPELILIDVRAFTQDDTRLEIRARRYLDSLPFFSINRIKAAFKAMSYIHEQNPDAPRFDASLLFSVIKYHNKWSEDYLLENNLGSKEQLYGGFYVAEKRSIRKRPHADVVFDPTQFKDLAPAAERGLYELIDYIKEKELNVLFVDTPQFPNENELGRSNTTYKILEENNMKVLHFYKEGTAAYTIDLDKANDFYDESHVNYYGAEKFTTALADYLIENYDLPDRRNDESADAVWAGKYDKIKSDIALFEKKKK